MIVTQNQSGIQIICDCHNFTRNAFFGIRKHKFIVCTYVTLTWGGCESEIVTDTIQRMN